MLDELQLFRCYVFEQTSKQANKRRDCLTSFLASRTEAAGWGREQVDVPRTYMYFYRLVNTTVLDSTYYPDMFREEEKAGKRLPPVCVYPRSPPFHSYITPQHASGLDLR